MRSPSPKCSVAATLNDPGTGPPMSAQCPLFWAKAMMRPSEKIGRTKETSLMWVPPRYGSLIAKTSPGWMSSPNSSITALHWKCRVPTWTAMSPDPCITVLPRASHSADEKSRE